MAVITARSACRLPVELLSMVMESMSMQALLTVSHVCAHWRAVAHSHPTYWREIRLAAVSTTALDFFLARLSYTANRGINMTIQLAEIPPSAGPLAVVFRALARHLSRVAYLALDLHVDIAPHALPELLTPAQHLESLRLRFLYCNEQRPAVLLPPDLFARSSPQLLAATLSNVELPKDLPITAFERVDSLIFSFKRPRAFSTALFDHFPAARSLCVFGKFCLGTLRDRKAISPAIARRLSWLEIHIEPCNYDLFLSIPDLGSITHIACRKPDAPTAELLLSHLEGPLEIDVHKLLGSLLRISFCSLSSGLYRMFDEREVHLLRGDDWPSEALWSAQILERITTLRLDARFAYLTSWFAELPNCRTLVLTVPARGLPSHDTKDVHSLRLPKLADVLVCTGVEEDSAGEVTVSADQLHSLLTRLLGPRKARNSLSFDGVSLSGDSDAICRDFKLRC